MLKKPHIRRPLAALLVVLGAMMMFFATGARAGGVLLILGITLEVIGTALKHRDPAVRSRPFFHSGKCAKKRWPAPEASRFRMLRQPWAPGS